MKSKSILILAAVIIVISACRKKDKPEPVEEVVSNPSTPAAPPPPAKEFLPLKIGNYWVYKLDARDANTDTLISSGQDSAYVYDTVTIRNRLFYKINSNNLVLNNGTYSDSADCIINQNGLVCFKSTNSPDTITKETNAQAQLFYANIMKPSPSTYSFNNQTYSSCINKHSYAKQLYTGGCTKEWDNLYSRNIGLVYGRINYASILCIKYYEQKLLRYKVN